MTLNEYMKRLGWNIADMAREARVDRRTVVRAINGETVSSRAAQAIAEALSASLGERILVSDIAGLSYR